jgi:hypothetical protein
MNIINIFCHQDIGHYIYNSSIILCYTVPKVNVAALRVNETSNIGICMVF